MPFIAPKLFLFAFAVLLVVFSAILTFRRARRLESRIKAFKAEQAELKRQGKLSNPYADLAELYKNGK